VDKTVDIVYSAPSNNPNPRILEPMNTYVETAVWFVDGFARRFLKTAVNADDYDLEHKLPGVICALDGCEKSQIRRQRYKDDWH
jgi:hypothetical protein